MSTIRFNKSAVAALLVVAGIGAAHAQGLYVGGAIGTPDYKDPINGVDGRGSGMGAKLYGGYQFTPNIAVEGGLMDLGHIKDATGQVNTRGVFVDAVGTYEFMPRWSVLGSAGLAHAQFTSSNGDDTSPALKLGAGVQYDLSKTVALRGEYEQYHFSSAYDSKPNVGEFSVGVKVGF